MQLSWTRKRTCFKDIMCKKGEFWIIFESSTWTSFKQQTPFWAVAVAWQGIKMRDGQKHMMEKPTALLCFSKMQPYLGRKCSGKVANCGNGSHIEAVVRRLRLRLQIAHGLTLWSIYHPSQAFQTNSLSCCRPSATTGNKCFGIFVLSANEDAAQDQAAEVVNHPALFPPWLCLFTKVKY